MLTDHAPVASHSYDVVAASSAADTAAASAATLSVLPHAIEPYSEYDLVILQEILQLAEARAAKEYASGRGSKELTLPKLLKAYEVVLPRHSIAPQEDIHYYRLLLKLSLEPGTDWWAKFEHERKATAR